MAKTPKKLSKEDEKMLKMLAKCLGLNQEDEDYVKHVLNTNTTIEQMEAQMAKNTEEIKEHVEVLKENAAIVAKMNLNGSKKISKKMESIKNLEKEIADLTKLLEILN